MFVLLRCAAPKRAGQEECLPVFVARTFQYTSGTQACVYVAPELSNSATKKRGEKARRARMWFACPHQVGRKQRLFYILELFWTILEHLKSSPLLRYMVSQDSDGFNVLRDVKEATLYREAVDHDTEQPALTVWSTGRPPFFGGNRH